MEDTMKKWLKVLGSLVVVGLLAAVFAGTVLAQGPVEDGDGVRDLDGSGLAVGRGPAYGFIDEDGDGINDRYTSDPAFVDEDGDGVCDIHGVVPGTGTAMGYGYGFIDEDGDGINDRYASDPAFVDEDGDGVCDLHGVTPGTAMAQRMGRTFRTNSSLQSNLGTPRSASGRWAAGQ
jgi:hypothetical protein